MPSAMPGAVSSSLSFKTTEKPCMTPAGRILGYLKNRPAGLALFPAVNNRIHK